MTKYSEMTDEEYRLVVDKDLSDIEQIDRQTKQWLTKFFDIDWFFNKAQFVVQRYFQEQDDFENLKDFEKYLKNGLKMYVRSFYLEWKEKRKTKNSVLDFSYKYPNLIYFLDDSNPIQERKENVSQRTWEIVEWNWKK